MTSGAYTDRYFDEFVCSVNDGRPDEPSDRDGVKLSNGPLDGVVADSAPDGAAVKKVPLNDSVALAFPEKRCEEGPWTYELDLKEMMSSEPESRETTQTWFISVGSTTSRISFGVSSSAPSGATGRVICEA